MFLQRHLRQLHSPEGQEFCRIQNPLLCALAPEAVLKAGGRDQVSLEATFPSQAGRNILQTVERGWEQLRGPGGRRKPPPVPASRGQHFGTGHRFRSLSYRPPAPGSSCLLGHTSRGASCGPGACGVLRRLHLLTGSHKRSCRTATRLPGRGRWPRNQRSLRLPARSGCNSWRLPRWTR